MLAAFVTGALRVVSLCRADKILLAGGAALGSAALLAGPVALGVCAGALLATLADGIFRPGSSTLYPTASHGPRTGPLVSLTFDDGPHPQTTPQALDTLAAFQARATFFMIGRHLEQYPALAQRALAAGHELGNHSWQHSYAHNFYSTRMQRADIARCSTLIRQLTGSPLEPLYRAPVGLKSPPLARVAHMRKLALIAWSLHGRDTFSRDPAVIAQRVLARIRPGDIVLLHDGHQRARQRRDAGIGALPLILRGLEARGLRCVPVAELLGLASGGLSAARRDNGSASAAPNAAIRGAAGAPS